MRIQKGIQGFSIVVILACLLLSGFTWAQTEVRLELGFNNQVVTDHWNPLRLTTTDLPTSTLQLRLFRGTLRGGEVPFTITLPLERRSGISVLEEDIYLPAWRSFNWLLSSSDRTLASGSYNRSRGLVPSSTTLNLIVSTNPSRWFSLFDGSARITDSAASLLPERLAAYDGVATVLVDGSTAVPSLKALAAAASAGATVLIIEPLPSSYESLDVLAPLPLQRLGMGHFVRGTEEEVKTLLSTLTPLDKRALEDALIAEDLNRLPEPTNQLTLLIALLAYVIVLLITVRFAGGAGLITGLSLALIASLVFWAWLRPDEPQRQAGRILSIGAGQLANTLELRQLSSLPKSEVSLPILAYPDGLSDISLELMTGAEQTTGNLLLRSERWSRHTFRAKPVLEPALLDWHEGQLRNLSSVQLFDVVIKGQGPQMPLNIGESRQGSDNEAVNYSDVYDSLLRLIPDGSALARDGGHIHIALPPKVD